eukprot:404597-Prymnesium_polylepis.2
MHIKGAPRRHRVQDRVGWARCTSRERRGATVCRTGWAGLGPGSGLGLGHTCSMAAARLVPSRCSMASTWRVHNRPSGTAGTRTIAGSKPRACTADGGMARGAMRASSKGGSDGRACQEAKAAAVVATLRRAPGSLREASNGWSGWLVRAEVTVGAAYSERREARALSLFARHSFRWAAS